MKLQGKSIMLI